MQSRSLYDVKALFRELAKGDEMAFRQIFDLFKHRVKFVALKVLKDPINADEIVQEVFLKVWKNQQKFEDIDDPEGYLFTSTYNTIYSWLRKTANEEKAIDHLIASMRIEEVLHGEDIIIAGETKALIDQAIESLPPQRKLIFTMSRKEGLSHQEIADQLNLSRHTVHNQINQALQTIRSFLSRAAMALLLMCWNSF